MLGGAVELLVGIVSICGWKFCSEKRFEDLGGTRTGLVWLSKERVGPDVRIS